MRAVQLPFGQRHHWWQTRPFVGLAFGWIVIALAGWRLWVAFAAR